MPDDFKENRVNKKLYNSVVNLQLLEKETNIQKSDIPLKEWVESQTKGFSDVDKQAFLENRLIPNVSLEEADIAKFFEERKKMLVSKLKTALSLI